MRIALTQFTAWPEIRRGAERYVHELAGALSGLGHEVQVLATAPTGSTSTVLGVPTTLLERSTAEGLAGRRPRLDFAAECLRRVRGAGVDVWHANSLYDGAAAALWSKTSRRTASVFTLHGPADPARLRQGLDRASFALVRRSSALVTVSEPAARELLRDYRAASQVVSPGVDTDSFLPGGRRAPRPVVLYVGTLSDSRKNVPLLLDGVDALARAGVDVEVWLAGQGDAGPLLAAAPSLVRDRVRVLGPLEGEALVTAYRQAWVTALVSRREVFGMAVVESLACGTPAVVLADGWGPEGILRPGCGFAVPPDAAAVGSALGRAIDLAGLPDTVSSCRALAGEYDWSRRIAPRMVEVYEKALS